LGQSRHVSLIFINRLWGQYNPEQARAFVAGVVDAINWIEANQDEAKPIISKYTGIPVESVSDYHFTPDGRVRIQDINTWLEYLLERGDVPDWVDPASVATDIYNPNSE
jgi:ABC-type nitrate/sulfonate/bicarbonate transport system substrate-binding protein